MQTRRDFLKITGKFGALLAVSIAIPASMQAKPTPKSMNGDEPISEIIDFEMNQYIVITKDNKIILFNPRPDMGQGTNQSLPTLLAEELEVDLEQVEVRFTNGHSKFGGQSAGGSSSIRTRYEELREAGAAARVMLIGAAAKKWGVPVTECLAKKGKVLHPKTGKSALYGELSEDAAKLEIPQGTKLKEIKDFKLIGKDAPRLDIPNKVCGKALFGIDIKVPNMLYATIQHSPMIHGKVKSFDTDAAMKIAGVKQVLKSERPLPYKTLEGVAVLADTYWGALQARKTLNVVWENADYQSVTTENYFQAAHSVAKSAGTIYKDAVGDVSKSWEFSETKLEGVYETPFTAHASMEPNNTVAWVKEDGSVEVWCPVQGPDSAVNKVADYLKIKPEQVKINVQLMGGSFGRKAYLDFVLEAVYLSKQAKAPVKLIWTREDDLTQGPFRPGMVNSLKAALDKDGHLTTFEHRVAGASILHQVFQHDQTGKADSWASEGMSQEDSPYEIPNRRQTFSLVETPIPILWWRSVYASTNAFGQECFIDEIAHASKKDPFDFRLEYLKKEPRFLKVLKMLEEKANYRQKLPAGQAIGIAITRSFKSICAYAVTVSKKGNNIVIDKVVGVIDVGLAVIPDNVKAQTEGNVVMGLSTALKSGINIEKGAVQETNFHAFNPLRINETPPIEIHVMPSEEAPSGAGEPGLPPIAPALCNAIFNLNGKRIRKLPFSLEN
jgi:isoquinoline 1-oxidoreductase subunit beta